jgi:hypothetical protein
VVKKKIFAQALARGLLWMYLRSCQQRAGRKALKMKTLAELTEIADAALIAYEEADEAVVAAFGRASTKAEREALKARRNELNDVHVLACKARDAAARTT